ncbi:MAG: HPr kinase/phosphatase C-terminal domain-containing protein [Bdellovibrionales bacterium]|nr:HPr kinase/phosphatase C-terminal domain-containing protein [Bdellovibrionales bacterium]
MKPQNPNRVIRHGTAVLVSGGDHPPAAVFIRGASGSGKSDLAFRLLGLGGTLISDDQVELEKRQDRIYAGAVDAIRGLIEVRGIGLLRYPVADPAPLKLVIDLVPREDVPRMPDMQTMDILGVSIPLFKLYAFDASSVHKLRAALAVVHRPEMIVK